MPRTYLSGHGHSSRRGSSTGLPPLPPNINSRSHSLDGLLGSSNNTNSGNTKVGKANATGEGPNPENFDNEYAETNEHVNKSSESVKSNNRRSRSLDNLIDSMSNESSTSLDYQDIGKSDSKSLENILGNDDGEIFRKSDSSFTEKPCEKEIITIDNSLNINTLNNENGLEDQSQNDSGMQCCSGSDNDSLPFKTSLQSDSTNINNSDNTSITDDNVSMSISNASSDQKDDRSSNKSNKTFLNKYVKKVKKFIKK